MTLHLLNAKLLDVEGEVYNKNVTVSLLIVFCAYNFFVCCISWNLLKSFVPVTNEKELSPVLNRIRYVLNKCHICSHATVSSVYNMFGF